VTTCIIKKVEPIPGLVPSLRFATSVRLDFGQANARLFVLKWVGEIGFTRQPEQGGSMAPAGPGKLVLPATWASEVDGHATKRLSGVELHANFTCEMTPTILDGVERFREGGRLFARVQGKFQALVLGTYQSPTQEVLTEIIGGLTNPQVTVWTEACGDSFEVTRDVWCMEILPVLRPPGRVILEAALPALHAEEDHGRRALSHLDAAQRAFDEGRYEETARLVYKAGEALQQLGSNVEACYGDLAKSSIAKQNSALQALCHPERHDESKVVGGHDTDRPMALHLLTSMKSLAAVYLNGR
jgi:hypothetical protein